MHYVYILRSDDHLSQYYTGCTADLRSRLEAHNAGRVPHTAKFKPWTLSSYHAFAEKAVAIAFEQYLKSGSGRAFASRHLRPTP